MTSTFGTKEHIDSTAELESKKSRISNGKILTDAELSVLESVSQGVAWTPEYCADWKRRRAHEYETLEEAESRLQESQE